MPDFIGRPDLCLLIGASSCGWGLGEGPWLRAGFGGFWWREMPSRDPRHVQ